MAVVSISLPASVARQVDMETRRVGFSTRSEFIRNILRRYFTGELMFEPFEAKPLQKIKLDLARTKKYSKKFIESVVEGLSRSSLYAN